MAVTLNLGSKVIYSGESTTLTATVAGKTLTKAVFTYWVDGITSSKVSVNMTRNGATATIDLKTVFNAYNLDEIEFVYQVEVAYLSKNAEKVTSGNVTTTTTETQTDFSNQQSVIFRSTTNKALKVKETTNLEHPFFATRNNGFVNGALKNANAKTFTDNFEQATAKVDNKNELLPLVDVTHPLASKVRVKTPKGIKAVAQKTANFKNRGGATSKFYGDVTKATTTYSSQISGYSKDTYITSSPSYSYLSSSKANYAPKYYYYSYGSTTNASTSDKTSGTRYGYYYYNYTYRYYGGSTLSGYSSYSVQLYAYHTEPSGYGYYRYGYTAYKYISGYYSRYSYYYYYYYYYRYTSGYYYYNQKYGTSSGYGYYKTSGALYRYSNPAKQQYSTGGFYYVYGHTEGYGAYGYRSYITSYRYATNTAGYSTRYYAVYKYYYAYGVDHYPNPASYTYYYYYYYYYNYTKGYTATTSASNGYYITGYTNTYGYKYKHNYGYYYKPTYTNVANTTYSKYYYTK